MEFKLVSEQSTILSLVAFIFLMWTLYLEVKLKMNYTMSKLITQDLKIIQFRTHWNQILGINMLQTGIASALAICLTQQQCKLWPSGDICIIAFYSLILKVSQCKAKTMQSDIIGIMSLAYLVQRLPTESSPTSLLEQISDFIIFGTVFIPFAILLIVAYFVFTFLYSLLAFVTFVTVSVILQKWRSEIGSMISKWKKSSSVLLLLLLSTSTIITVAYNKSLRNAFETCDNLEDKISMQNNHERENLKGATSSTFESKSETLIRETSIFLPTSLRSLSENNSTPLPKSASASTVSNAIKFLSPPSSLNIKPTPTNVGIEIQTTSSSTTEAMAVTTTSSSSKLKNLTSQLMPSQSETTVSTIPPFSIESSDSVNIKSSSDSGITISSSSQSVAMPTNSETIIFSSSESSSVPSNAQTLTSSSPGLAKVSSTLGNTTSFDVENTSSSPKFENLSHASGIIDLISSVSSTLEISSPSSNSESKEEAPRTTTPTLKSTVTSPHLESNMPSSSVPSSSKLIEIFLHSENTKISPSKLKASTPNFKTNKIYTSKATADLPNSEKSPASLEFPAVTTYSSTSTVFSSKSKMDATTTLMSKSTKTTTSTLEAAPSNLEITSKYIKLLFDYATLTSSSPKPTATSKLTKSSSNIPIASLKPTTTYSSDFVAVPLGIKATASSLSDSKPIPPNSKTPKTSNHLQLCILMLHQYATSPTSPMAKHLGLKISKSTESPYDSESTTLPTYLQWCLLMLQQHTSSTSQFKPVPHHLRSITSSPASTKSKLPAPVSSNLDTSLMLTKSTHTLQDFAETTSKLALIPSFSETVTSFTSASSDFSSITLASTEALITTKSIQASQVSKSSGSSSKTSPSLFSHPTHTTHLEMANPDESKNHIIRHPHPTSFTTETIQVRYLIVKSESISEDECRVTATEVTGYNEWRLTLTSLKILINAILPSKYKNAIPKTNLRLKHLPTNCNELTRGDEMTIMRASKNEIVHVERYECMNCPGDKDIDYWRPSQLNVEQVYRSMVKIIPGKAVEKLTSYYETFNWFIKTLFK